MDRIDKDTNIKDLIKQTPISELSGIADSLREELIDDVAVSGGHLASNLGVVELTVALYKVFSFPKDKLIWDVGHQCYVHKMISGRREQMTGMRHLDGISGFPKRAESPYDMYDSGHTSNSVSAALGYAAARDLDGDDYSCIAVIGDGALTGGEAFEGLNNAGASNIPLIVVLNDNQMSIGSSVGSTAKSLNRIRTSKSYIGFKNAVKKSKDNIPGLYRFLKNTRDLIKYAFVPDQIFEELGFKYYGPIDGHDIEEMVDALEFAKASHRPVILHIATKKGKGYKPAEDDPSKFHGVGAFDRNDPASTIKSKRGWSEIFGDDLLQLAEKDNKIVAVSAAMIDATGLGPMQRSFPARVFDVGIAEQHAVSFAAGLALNGYKPVVAIYSTFLQRAFDQICTEVCLQNLPVVFAIDRAGVTGADGETHQGTFDISYLAEMPNMTILSAYDESSFKQCLEYAFTLGTPVALRYGKTEPAILDASRSEGKPGASELKEGFENLILCDGAFVKESLYAAKHLRSSVAVYAMEVLKPLDYDQICSMLKKYKAVITIEDGTYIGGFGSMISQIAATDRSYARVLNLAWPDKFIEHGSINELRKRYGLDEEGVLSVAEDFFESQT